MKAECSVLTDQCEFASIVILELLRIDIIMPHGERGVQSIR